MADDWIIVGDDGDREDIAEWLQPKQMKVDESLEGVYVDSFFKKTGVNADTGKDEGWTAHKVKRADGKLCAIYGTGGLDYRMKQVAKGAKIKIIYKGKDKVTDGKLKGKSVHQFLVKTNKKVGALEEAPF